MRCPKCGFISFDHLETCKNCQKPLGDLIALIGGTTYDATPPMFLTVSSADSAPASSSAAAVEPDILTAPAAAQPMMHFEESDEQVFSLDEDFSSEEPHKEIEFPDGADGLLLDLDNQGEPNRLAKDVLRRVTGFLPSAPVVGPVYGHVVQRVMHHVFLFRGIRQGNTRRHHGATLPKSSAARMGNGSETGATL